MTLADRAAPLAEQIGLFDPPSPDEERPLPGAHVRLAFGLSYDGAGFHGFAPQPTVRTVGGAFVAALSELVDEQVRCVSAGRTDAGVHATAQVVHADVAADIVAGRFRAGTNPGVEIEALRRALAARLSPEIGVWRVVVVDAEFSARHSALSRRYRYNLDVGGRATPLRRRNAWQLDAPLDLPTVRLATDAFIGEHDFSGYCRRPADQPSGPVVRRVFEASWKVSEGRYAFEIEARAFAQQMVRSIVGALVAVGHGRVRPSDLVERLRSGTRTGAPTVAPPEGLCLVGVRYPEPFGTW